MIFFLCSYAFYMDNNKGTICLYTHPCSHLQNLFHLVWILNWNWKLPSIISQWLQFMTLPIFKKKNFWICYFKSDGNKVSLHQNITVLVHLLAGFIFTVQFNSVHVSLNLFKLVSKTRNEDKHLRTWIKCWWPNPATML
jgi:hypothetical protein